MKKFGLFTYKTANIGDEIQSLAARRFLPRVDIYVDRDRVGDFSSTQECYLISNGWYIHVWTAFLFTGFFHSLFSFLPGKLLRAIRRIIIKVESNLRTSWPPSESLNLLPVSMHFDQGGIDRGAFLSKKSLAYLRKIGPIGCRDRTTHQLLEKNNVSSYFSGCMTLTFPENHEERGRSIFIVDVEMEDQITEHIPDCHQVKKRTHDLTFVDRLSAKSKRYEKAEALLNEYRSAHLVITSRLHVALPCVSFGTPVIFLHSNLKDPRFDGLIEHTNHYQPGDFVAMLQENKFNWDNPPENPGTHFEIRNKLIQKCQAWVKRVDESN